MNFFHKIFEFPSAESLWRPFASVNTFNFFHLRCSGTPTSNGSASWFTVFNLAQFNCSLTEIQNIEFAKCKSTSKNVASSWETLTPSKSRVISPIICCAWPFCLRYAVEATGKYISDNKNKYLLHLLTARGFLICPNSDFCRSAKRISARLPVYLSLLCEQFWFLDSETLPFINVGIIKKQLSVHNSSRRL